MTVAIATTLAGILLMLRNISLTGGAWARSPMGIGISIGATTAILALIVGMTVSAPAAKRLGGPPQPGATPLSDEERSRLMRRTAIASQVVLILLAISALTMATARYY